MSVTIGLVANMYNEANSLPGWIETHIGFFDDIKVLHAGPNGEYSNDGTIEILEKWKIPTQFCAIDDGFGVVRTKALRMCPCDYIMLLDADERFYPVVKRVACIGEGTPQQEVDWILQSYDFRGVNLPNWENIAKLGQNLRVEEVGMPLDQGSRLRELLDHWKNFNNHPIDAVATVRRHWHDFSMKKPTQSWYEHQDWQLRLVRNLPSIGFSSDTRMHEQLMGAEHIYHADQRLGPFFDHFHFTFKKMEQQQRAHDISIYDSIHEGKKPPTYKEYLNKQ